MNRLRTVRYWFPGLDHNIRSCKRSRQRTLSLPHVHTTAQALQRSSTAASTQGQGVSAYEPLVTPPFPHSPYKTQPYVPAATMGQKRFGVLVLLDDSPSKADSGPFVCRTVPVVQVTAVGTTPAIWARRHGGDSVHEHMSCDLYVIIRGFIVSLSHSIHKGKKSLTRPLVLCKSLSPQRQLESRGPFP